MDVRQMNEAPAGGSSSHKRAGSGSIEPSNSKKQRPLSVTCNNCREKKVKCSGQNPCNGCQRSGSLCVFRERLKPGLKVGTGESAMSRLQELQIRLEALEDWRLQVELGNALHSAPLLDQSDDIQPHALPGLLDIGNEPHISGSPNQWRPSLPIPATSRGTDACHFDSTGSGDAGSAFYDHDQAGPSLFQPYSPPGVPPDNVVHSLIALYFQHIAPWAPVLHISQADTWQPPWPIFVHAMIAVSVRFSTDPDVRACSEKWRHEARKHVILHAAETTDIASLQALSIIVLDVIGSGSNPETWGLLALLTRSAIHLGLSKDERSMGNHEQTKLFCILARPVSFMEDESRRRLFFIIYMLDRHACVATGWDFAIRDDETSCRLPCRDSLWISADAVETPYFESSLHSLETLDDAMCDRLSPLAYQIQLVDLLGRVHALQAQRVNIESPREFDAFRDQARTLSAAVKRCYTSIPDRVLNPSATTDAPPNILSCILSATYYATLLKLCARFAYPARPSIVDAFMSMSCNEGISGMAKLARDITRHEQTAYVSPFFVWCIWVAARVAFIHSYTMREAPSDDLTSMIQCLKDCALTWGSAGRYAHLLDKALLRWQKQEPLTMFSQGGALAQAIAVLLDTTKTAYSAVAQDTVTPAEPVENAESHSWAVQPELEELHHWFNMPSLESLLTG